MPDEINTEPNIEANTQPNSPNNPPLEALENSAITTTESMVFDPYANLASGHIGLSQTEKNQNSIQTSQTLLTPNIESRATPAPSSPSISQPEPISIPESTPVPVSLPVSIPPSQTPLQTTPVFIPSQATNLEPIPTSTPASQELPEDPYLAKGIIKPPSQFQTPKPKVDLFANSNNTKPSAPTPNWSNRSINNSHIKSRSHISLSSDIPANAGLVTKIMFKTKLVKSEKDIVKVQLIIAGIFFGLSIAMLFIFIL